MQTVTFDNARLNEKTQELGVMPHVLRNLSIPASTFKYFSEVAANCRMEIDDFIIVMAWRQTVILANEMRGITSARRQTEAAATASDC